MNEVIAAIIGVISTIVVSLFSYIMARRAGIGPFQDTLVNTLKGVVDAQQKEIEIWKNKNQTLEIQVQEQRIRIDTLENKVNELTEVTAAQAVLIHKLTARKTRQVKTAEPASP